VVKLTDQAEKMPFSSTHSIAVEVDIPNYKFEFPDGTGKTLVQAANGASLFAGGDQLPLLPAALERLILPAGASDIQVTENVAARQGQDFGVVELMPAKTMTTDYVDTLPVPVLTTTYPSQSFSYGIHSRSDGVEVELQAVTGQVGTDKRLTLFSHMEFTLSYKLAEDSGASIEAVNLNNGKTVVSGQASLPLTLTVSSGQGRSLTLSYSVIAPSGYLVGSGKAVANISAGNSSVGVILSAERWPAGPQTLLVSIADSVTGAVLDSRLFQFVVSGLLVEINLQPASAPAGASISLTVEIRDEQGALQSGLLNHLSLSLDGSPLPMDLEESSPGLYQASLATSGFASGEYLIGAQVTDGRGLVGQGENYFAINQARVYLPLLKR